MVASATVWLKNPVGCTTQPTATAAAADARAAKGKGIARDEEREIQRMRNSRWQIAPIMRQSPAR